MMGDIDVCVSSLIEALCVASGCGRILNGFCPFDSAQVQIE